MDLYEYTHYKSFLSANLGKGIRANFLTAVGCQSSFLSQVLHGKVQLSLEHGIKVCRFFNFTTEQSEYFMTMLHFARAGSQELAKFYWQQLLQKRHEIKKVGQAVAGGSELTPLIRSEYYSRFIYAAVHVLCSLPLKDQESEMADLLNLTGTQLNQALQKLKSWQLIEQKNKRWVVKEARVHVGADQPETVHHHRNFRLEAIRQIENRTARDLHYSGVFALSEEDREKVRQLILKLISDKEKILGPSKEEVAYVFNLDFVQVR